ncbi:oligosaccharide flippase family protein [Flavobacteriaceae bacterium 3-367]|uniref:lipopolysaccharide biosynthesis protein n=1 Tax=Eudoraea algarum TaxID=3417568 RepID=UPI00328DFDFA
MRLIKDSIIYLSSSIINKSIPFFLLPILTNYLSPKEYGLLSIFLIVVTFYSAFIGMNININVSKNFFKCSKKELSIIIGNILFILFFSFILFFIVTLIGSIYIDTVFSIPKKWILIIPLISYMFMVNTLNLTILRNEEKALTFGIFEIVNTATTMSITILLLVCYKFGWQSQVIGILVSYFIFYIVSYIHMYRRGYITFKINSKTAKDILKTSLPLIPHVLGGIVITVSDRLFIEHMINLEVVGIYSVGYTFGLVVILFTDAFIKAWSPWFYKNLVNPTDKKKRQIVKYTYAYIAAIFLLSILISLAAEFLLPYVVDERYVGAKIYIFWIALGYAIHGIYKIFYPYLVHINKTAFLGFSSVFAAVLNLIFNYVLIDSFGAIGAAYATILAFIASSLLVFSYQNRNYPMPWNLKK